MSSLYQYGFDLDLCPNDVQNCTDVGIDVSCTEEHQMRLSWNCGLNIDVFQDLDCSALCKSEECIYHVEEQCKEDGSTGSGEMEVPYLGAVGSCDVVMPCTFQTNSANVQLFLTLSAVAVAVLALSCCCFRLGSVRVRCDEPSNTSSSSSNSLRQVTHKSIGGPRIVA